MFFGYGASIIYLRTHPHTMTCNTIATIIVNFNAGDLLGRCVSAALSCPRVMSIIISDNGSNDDSLNSMDSDPRLQILGNGENLGFAAANNRALELLDADYILFLNPDAKVDNCVLVTMIEFMNEHSDVGMCGPLILNEDGTEQRGCRRDEPTPLSALKTLIGKREKGINKVGTTLPSHPIEVDAISGAFMFVRREALDDVGPMDEGYFLHCEDLDWCKRFRDKGWKVMFLPDVTVTHFKGGSSRGRPVRVEWHKHKGMARYYRKFYRDQYPRPLMWLVYTAIWGRFLLLAPILTVKRWLK